MTAPRRLRFTLAPILLAALASGGCSSNRWNGKVEQYGDLGAAMGGSAGAHYPLRHAERDGRWGLGVLAGPGGEVVVADGFVWVGRADSPTQAHTEAGTGYGESAAWIAMARVPRWREFELERSLELEAVGSLAAELGAREGWDPGRALPFVVVGALTDVDVHVARGACPHSGTLPADPAPFRARFSVAHGTLVGLHAPGGGGALTHPGDTLHVHALLRQPTTLAAHVDGAWVMSGARLRIPARD